MVMLTTVASVVRWKVVRVVAAVNQLVALADRTILTMELAAAGSGSRRVV